MSFLKDEGSDCYWDIEPKPFVGFAADKPSHQLVLGQKFRSFPPEDLLGKHVARVGVLNSLQQIYSLVVSTFQYCIQTG